MHIEKNKNTNSATFMHLHKQFKITMVQFINKQKKIIFGTLNQTIEKIKFTNVHRTGETNRNVKSENSAHVRGTGKDTNTKVYNKSHIIKKTKQKKTYSKTLSTAAHSTNIPIVRLLRFKRGRCEFNVQKSFSVMCEGLG